MRGAARNSTSSARGGAVVAGRVTCIATVEAKSAYDSSQGAALTAHRQHRTTSPSPELRPTMAAAHVLVGRRCPDASKSMCSISSRRTHEKQRKSNSALHPTATIAAHGVPWPPCLLRMAAAECSVRNDWHVHIGHQR